MNKRLFFLVDDYINDRLSPRQRQRFEAAMQRHGALAAAVASARHTLTDIQAASAASADHAARARLNQRLMARFTAEHAKEHKPRRRLIWISALAAAIIAAVLLFQPLAPITQPSQAPAIARLETFRLVVPTADPRVKLYWTIEESSPGRLP